MKTLPDVAAAFRLLLKKPHYMMGRFSLVRAGYSSFMWLRQKLLGSSPLEIGNLYQPSKATLEIAPSGYVTSPLSPAEHARAVRAKSYSDKIQISAEAVEALQQCAKTWPLVGLLVGKVLQIETSDYASFKASPELYRQVAIATVRDAYRHPVLRALAQDPFLLETASRYLGYTPRRVSSWLFWSFANDLSDEERRQRYQTIDFHYDVDGLSFVYFSFYLIDTTRRNGAHVLVEGTHKGKRLRHLFGPVQLSDEQVATYRRPVKTFEGPAGTGFVEDTSCFHKALRPLDGERLALQLRYQ